MITVLRRLFWLGALGGAGYVGWLTWQRRTDDEGDPAPEWPPVQPPSSERIAASVPTADPAPPLTTDAPTSAARIADAAPAIDPETGHEPNPEAQAGAAEPDTDERPTLAEALSQPEDTSAPRWVGPVGDECPEGYPIKANDNSGIYHEPGGRFYDRTVPERCYVDVASAEADGYRAAKT